MASLVVSAVSSAIAVQIIISGLRPGDRSLFVGIRVIHIILVLLVELASAIAGVNLLYARIAIEFLVLLCPVKNVVDTLFCIMASETFILCIVFTAGPFIYLFPDLLYMDIYMLTMSFLVLAVSIIIRKLLYMIRQYISIISIKLKIIVTLLASIILIPITLLHRYFDRQEQLLIVTTMLLLYIMVFIGFIIYTCYVGVKNKELFRKKLNSEKQKEFIEKQYGRMTHFVVPSLKLLRKGIDSNDMETVRELYVKYVEPIQKKQLRTSEMEVLDLIKMQSIQACLYHAMLLSERITLNVNGYIHVPETIIPESELYLVLSEYLNNAITHIEGHSEGSISVLIMQEMNGWFIQVENTYYGEENNLCQDSKAHIGFGLLATQDILDKYSLIHHTYIQNNRYIQVLEL